MGNNNSILRNIRDRWQGNINRKMYGIISYIQNQMLYRQGVDFKEFAPYQYFYNLHKTMPLYDVEGVELIRMGGLEDGSYIMADDLSKYKIAYSLGIGTDVTWDYQMALRGYDIYQYDHTIKKLPRNHEKFHWSALGISNEDKGKFRTLKTLIHENGHDNYDGMILKMDIEGFEWDVLESIEEDILTKFDQILIELHGIAKQNRAEKVINCLRKLNETHFAVHIHGNNASTINYTGELVTPTLIEAAFLSKNKYTNRVLSDKNLPTHLDYPCKSDSPDVYIGKWNVK